MYPRKNCTYNIDAYITILGASLASIALRSTATFLENEEIAIETRIQQSQQQNPIKIPQNDWVGKCHPPTNPPLPEARQQRADDFYTYGSIPNQ